MSRKPVYRRSALSRLIQLLATLSLAVLIVVGAASLFAAGPDPVSPPETVTPTQTPVPSAPPELTPPPTPEPTPEPAPVPTEEPVPETGAAWHTYDNAIAPSDAVDLSYFSDAAFIGDSLSDGLLLYSELGSTGAGRLAYKGLNVQTAVSKEVLTVDGKKVSAVDALDGRSYGKVYILLGTNELGWYNDKRFYNTYAELVDAVRAKEPDAKIYLQTLLPVTAEKSRTHDYITNEKILVYNDLIAELAREKEVYLLDTHVSVMGEDGALPEDGSSDGVHLTKSYYAKWLDYLRTHTA